MNLDKQRTRDVPSAAVVLLLYQAERTTGALESDGRVHVCDVRCATLQLRQPTKGKWDQRAAHDQWIQSPSTSDTDDTYHIVRPCVNHTLGCHHFHTESD